jgi:hypothetical protein
MFHGYVLFFSPRLWRDAAQRWGGIGFWFLFLLVVVSWVPTLVGWSSSYSKFLRNEAPKLTSQVPPITISNGVASSPVPQPHTIYDTTTGKPLIVIDTTGATTQPPANAPSMLLTQNALIQREGPYRLKTHDLSQVQSFYIDSQKAAEYMEQGKTLLWVLVLPLFIFLTLIWRLVYMLILGGIGTAIARGPGGQLTFAGGMRLAAISMVPMILLDTLLCPMGWSPGCWWSLLEWGVPIVLFIIAVKSLAPRPGAGGAWGQMPPQPMQYPTAPPSAPWQPPPAPPPQWPGAAPPG